MRNAYEFTILKRDDPICLSGVYSVQALVFSTDGELAYNLASQHGSSNTLTVIYVGSNISLCGYYSRMHSMVSSVAVAILHNRELRGSYRMVQDQFVEFLSSQSSQSTHCVSPVTRWTWYHWSLSSS